MIGLDSNRLVLLLKNEMTPTTMLATNLEDHDNDQNQYGDINHHNHQQDNDGGEDSDLGSSDDNNCDDNNNDDNN